MITGAGVAACPDPAWDGRLTKSVLQNRFIFRFNFFESRFLTKELS